MDMTQVCAETTAAVLDRAAFLAPQVEAIVCSEERATYCELADRVRVIRAALIRLGVDHGDHVAICVGNGARWLELFYAITGVGAVAVPVNTRFRAPEVAYVLQQSRARYLFTAHSVLSSDFEQMLVEVCPAIQAELPDPALPDLSRVVFTDDGPVPQAALSWAEFIAAGESHSGLSQRHPAGDDVALIQYTSGTTSRPKGVLLTHTNMCVDAYVSAIRLGLRLGDRFHSVRPFFHVAGSTLSVLSSAQSLATLVTMPRFEAGAALEVLERERCTHFSGNDTIALMLLNHPDRPRRRLSLRGAWVAGSPAVLRRVMDELGAREAVSGYGQSEASPNVAQSAWFEDEDVRTSCAMLPEPGVSVRIVDPENNAPMNVGEPGEIQVQGWNVMRGYFDDPVKTAEAFTADGWLKTGDLGRLDATGRLHFIGRAKEMIRVGGENVAPAEVEDALHGHPAVKQAVVVGVPDERLVEVPFAFVILNENRECDAAELISWLAPRLAGFKMPRHVQFVDDFASVGMTASSKVQKSKLAEHAKRLVLEATA